MNEMWRSQIDSQKIKRMLLVALIALAVFAIVFKVYFKSNDGDKRTISAQENVSNNLPKIAKEIFDKEYTAKEGDTLSLILEALNTKNDEREGLIGAFEKVYSPTKIKVGNVFKLKFEEDGVSVVKMEYSISAEKVLVISRGEDNSFSAEEKEIVFDIKITNKANKVISSLFEAGEEIGLSAGTILLMADVFSGEIDFASDIREGDSFKIIYEQKYKDGELIMDGNILAAEFQNQGQVFRTFYFNDPGNASSYFDESGKSLKKAFLKSPLNYRYISSGYTSSRYHPVLKIVTSHRAIDYVAASGTPVVAVGDGRIVYAGWNSNGYGNYIGVRHGNGYATYYGHLSGFAKGIRVGVSVAQGQTIGYVGSTGYSTGSHLDYSMKLNGSYTNPMKVNVVVGDPVSKASKDAFDTYVEKMARLLDQMKPE